MRPLAPSDLECWQASSWVSSMCNHLGIQHAARKQRGPSTTPGPWAGSMIFSHQSDGVKVLVTQEKWDKTKHLLAALTCELAEGDWLKFKSLETARGFMIYVSRTYRPMIPFLLGIHHTLDSWRSNRREDGWRQNRLITSMESYEDEAAPDLGQAAVRPPSTVKAENRLADGLWVLTTLTDLEVPSLRRLRGSSKLKVMYGFGDSSGNGFGWSIYFGEEIIYEHGMWSETLCEEHSNYKELRNLVNALIGAGLEGKLTGREIFLYTDNQVSEGSYYRGTTASQLLFELVVELYILQMKYDIILHVILAGTRMMQQGTYDLSRGGGAGLATQGLAMRGEVPLSRGGFGAQCSAGTLYPQLVGGGRTSRPDSRRLAFRCPFEGAVFMCATPGCGGHGRGSNMYDVHKRPCCCHFFLCPLIMTYLWRKQLLKACAFRFAMTSICDIWPYTEHEPLGFFNCPYPQQA
jgi:hypothetical protein